MISRQAEARLALASELTVGKKSQLGEIDGIAAKIHLKKRHILALNVNKA